MDAVHVTFLTGTRMETMPCWSLYTAAMTVAAAYHRRYWYDNLTAQDQELYDMIEDRCPEFASLTPNSGGRTE